jgi:serine/threonine protein kinase
MSDMTPVGTRSTGDFPRFSDRYELKAQVGNGGMGAVYQALDRETNKTVAIKILQSRNTIELARFEQEANVLSELVHPGIVRYLEHGVTPAGAPYIAMEWLEGETLEERMVRSRLGAAEAAHVAALVLQALAVAHERGVVHRDIKPSNIFLVGWKLTEIRLLDFGIARRVFDPKRFTRKGSTVGTPLYTSPEQARGRADIDGRSDIFSLGCVFFEVLTGEPPFSGDTPLEVMTRVCSGRVPPISSRRAGVPPELEALVHHMLSPQPAARPRSAAELARQFMDLERRLGGIREVDKAPKPPPSHHSRTLSENEEHLYCGMLVALARRSEDPVPSLTERRLGPRPITSPENHRLPALIIDEESRMAEVHRLLEIHSCSLDHLVSRTLFVSAQSACTAEEQALILAQAALALRELEPDARMVIATGRAVFIGRLPEGHLMELLPTLMVGQAPGCIRLDSTTNRLLPSRFAVSGPPDNLLLLAETRTVGSDKPREIKGVPSPFVGRERDLETLHLLWRDSAEDHALRTVLVLGEAGLGKTRLVREFLVSLGDRAPALLRAGGTLVRKQTPCPALRSLYMAAGVDLMETTPTVLEEPIIALMKQRSESKGLILLLEDLQWADAASLAVIDQVMAALDDRRILVIGLGRLEVEDRFPGLFAARSLEYIRLRPLTRKQGEGLVRTHLVKVDRTTLDFIMDRWGGSPRFLEEICLATLEGGLGVPQVVQAAVEDRFEGLEPDVRRLLRAVSLFGDKPIPEGAVLALLGDSASKGISEWFEILVMREIVERDTSTGESLYRFREKILREAAYRMLNPTDRLLARNLAKRWLEEEGRTLPEVLTAPLSHTSRLAVNT